MVDGNPLVVDGKPPVVVEAGKPFVVVGNPLVVAGREPGMEPGKVPPGGGNPPGIVA